MFDNLRLLFSPDADGAQDDTPQETLPLHPWSAVDEKFFDKEMEPAEEPPVEEAKETETPEPAKPADPPAPTETPKFKSAVLGGKEVDLTGVPDHVRAMLEEQERTARQFQSQADKLTDAISRPRPQERPAPPPQEQPKRLTAQEVDELWEQAELADDPAEQARIRKKAREADRKLSAQTLQEARAQDQQAIRQAQQQLQAIQFEKDILNDGVELLAANGIQGDAYTAGYRFNEALTYLEKRDGGYRPSHTVHANNYALEPFKKNSTQPPTKADASPGATTPKKPVETAPASTASPAPRGQVQPKRGDDDEPQVAEQDLSNNTFDKAMQMWSNRMTRQPATR